jgi:hypothetical protein
MGFQVPPGDLETGNAKNFAVIEVGVGDLVM